MQICWKVQRENLVEHILRKSYILCIKKLSVTLEPNWGFECVYDNIKTATDTWSSFVHGE